MTVFRQLIVVELVSVASLLLVAAAMAAYGAIDSASHANSLIDPAGSAWIAFGYATIIGAIPVILIGAPIYLLLLRRGAANWLNVMMLGVIPGVILLFVAGGLGFWAILCGAAIASLVHMGCRKLGPNNSFKPKPHRGGA